MMNKFEKEIRIEYHLNTSVRSDCLSSIDLTAPEDVIAVTEFHKSIPGYIPTPLIKLPELAKKLGASELLIKDESERFDLNAFKVLGASYAMAKVLKAKLELDEAGLTFDTISSQANIFRHLTFVTATDGNHGRAMAWSAKKFGCNAVVYMPKGSSKARLAAIQNYDAEASIIERNYDETVLFADKMAKENAWILLQDTSWEGYETIPAYIMQGYFTLLTEALEQAKGIWPTHVFVQAGVGSLAASLLAFLCSFVQEIKPVFVLVEPLGAPCFFNSIQAGDGKPHRVRGDLKTIMAGLACGKPSQIGWEILKTGTDAFIVCSDEIARRGMRILGNPSGDDKRVISGESGAVTLGLVYELFSNAKYRDIKDKLHLKSDAKILLFSTEGDTDPEHYRKVVC